MSLPGPALAASLALVAIGLAGTPARAAMPAPAPVRMQDAIQACQRALPGARRFVGQPGRVAQRRFRAPRGVIVRACFVCTRDYRRNRLTFGLDPAGNVRSVACN